MIKKIEIDNGVLTPIAVDATEGVASLYTALDTGVAKFGYRKKSDGSFRIAYGTRKRELIPKYKEADVAALLQGAKNMKSVYDNIVQNPDGVEANLKGDTDAFVAHSEHLDGCIRTLEPEAKEKTAKASSLINYYDFEAGAFRAFDPANLEVIF